MPTSTSKALTSPSQTSLLYSESCEEFLDPDVRLILQASLTAAAYLIVVGEEVEVEEEDESKYILASAVYMKAISTVLPLLPADSDLKKSLLIAVDSVTIIVLEKKEKVFLLETSIRDVLNRW